MKAALALLVLATSLVAASSATAAKSPQAPNIRVGGRHLEAVGRTVTVFGKGYPANADVQIQEATGMPLMAQALTNVTANRDGEFRARVLVSYDFSALNPYPPTATCSLMTFAGYPCLLFATQTGAPYASAYTPLEFGL